MLLDVCLMRCLLVVVWFVLFGTCCTLLIVACCVLFVGSCCVLVVAGWRLLFVGGRWLFVIECCLLLDVVHEWSAVSCLRFAVCCL